MTTPTAGVSLAALSEQQDCEIEARQRQQGVLKWDRLGWENGEGRQTTPVK